MSGLQFGPARPGRGIALALLIALGLHAPTLPSLRGLLGALIPESPTDDGPQQELILPIELDLAGDDDRPMGEETDSPPPLDEDEVEGETQGETPAPEPEAEAPEPEPEAPEPEPEPPEPPEPDTEPLPAPPPLPRGKLADPFRAAGDVSRLRAATPNVNIYVASDVLRTRKLSKRFGDLLASIPQWDQLLGGTNLDPMRDFDHVLLSAPQMRNPKWLVATVHFNTPAQRVKAAVDEVIARSGEGAGWIDGYDGILAAAIGPKDMRRYAVILPERQLLVVLPEGAKDQIQQVAKLPPFEKSGRAGIVLDVVNPKKAFRVLPFDIPESLTRMRLHFAPVEGGYDVRIEGFDKDAATAKATAKHLQAEFEPAFSFSKKALIAKVIGGIAFKSDKNHVLGRFSIGEDKLALVLDYAAGLVEAQIAAGAKATRDATKGRPRLSSDLAKHAPPIKHLKPGLDDAPASAPSAPTSTKKAPASPAEEAASPGTEAAPTAPSGAATASPAPAPLTPVPPDVPANP